MNLLSPILLDDKCWWLSLMQINIASVSSGLSQTCHAQKTAFCNVPSHSQFLYSFCPLFCDVLEGGDIDVSLKLNATWSLILSTLTIYVWVNAAQWRGQLSAVFIHRNKYICLGSNLISCPFRKNNSCNFSARTYNPIPSSTGFWQIYSKSSCRVDLIPVWRWLVDYLHKSHAAAH